MVARKIQDETELMRWYEQGMTYAQMAEKYLEKYQIEVTPDLFSSWRARKGLPKRIVRDVELIPWYVLPEHRYNYDVSMLRLEARRRAGGHLSSLEAQRLDGWKRSMAADDAVIHYDPETPEGFHRIRREPGDDDLIHRPARPTTKMRNAN
jgi:hypothetical protein